MILHGFKDFLQILLASFIFPKLKLSMKTEGNEKIATQTTKVHLRPSLFLLQLLNQSSLPSGFCNNRNVESAATFSYKTPVWLQMKLLISE